MKCVPNIFTLLNLFFGCIAILIVIQQPLIGDTDQSGGFIFYTYGNPVITLPENIYLAPVFIGLAALVDFFDGMVARLCKVTSELGKQLDSLADVVSFGVAPGMIIYQFLRLGFSQQVNGLDTSILWLMPAFILPCAGAYRLARFNVDTLQSFGFKGVPIPAVGLLLASFPLLYLYTKTPWIKSVLLSPWFWYALTLLVSYLMVSSWPMMSLKFKDFSVKTNLPKLIVLGIAIFSALLFQWMAVPLVFITYVVVSLLTQPKHAVMQKQPAEFQV